MNSPMASWLRRSCRIVRTMRGENWPMASCTATRVSDSTTPVESDISAVAIVVRIVCTSLAELRRCAGPGRGRPGRRATVTNGEVGAAEDVQHRTSQRLERAA